jgi:branched-chain amino acid transport system permease protein
MTVTEDAGLEPAEVVDSPLRSRQAALGWLGSLVLVVLAACLPAVLGAGYYLELATLVLLNAVFLMSLDLAVGRAGLVSVGHGSLLGLGSYVTGVLCVHYGLSFWPTVPVAMAVCGVIGLGIGVITLRLAGHYFVIGSLGLAVIISIVVTQWSSLTNGNLGLSPIPRPAAIGVISFDDPRNFYEVMLAAAVVVALASWAFLRTTTGSRLRAIRENPRLASALGVNVYATRILVLVVSALLVGFAGSFQASYLGYIGPQVVDYVVGFQAVMALIIGGQRSIAGAFVGALFFVLVPQALQFASNLSVVVFGAALIVVVILAPDGLWGRFVALLRWTRARVGTGTAR